MSHNISVNIKSIPLGRKVRFLELKTGIWSNLQDLTFGTGLIYLLTINKKIKRIFKGTVEIFYIDPLFIECKQCIEQEKICCSVLASFLNSIILI